MYSYLAHDKSNFSLTNRTDRLQAYDKYCAEHASWLPLFYHSWYLDAACEEAQWDAAIYHKGDHVLGIWPYYLKKKWSIHYITMPPLTPRMGPIYRVDSSLKPAVQYQKEKKILTDLHDQLPATQLSTIYRSTGQYSSLPLHAMGYEVHRRYTYQIRLDSMPHIQSQMAPKQTATIKKARERYSLRVDTRADDFIVLNEETYRRQGISMPYNKEVLRRIDQALSAHHARTILTAVGPTGTPEASIYLAHDSVTVYLLAIGSQPESRHHGGVPWLIDQALRRFVDSHSVFDFEGGMIPRIEHFFRSFGGQQVSYDHLIKTPNRWMRALWTLAGRI